MTAPASSPDAPIPLPKGSVLFGIGTRIRRRRTTAAASEKSSTYGGPSGTPTARHACSAVLDGMPQLDSPLITELIALQAHTRNLGWLSAREPRPDEYQHLARLVLQHVLEGWRAQTGGRGRLEDLLAQPDPVGAVRGSCKDDPDQTTSYGG